MWRQAGGTGRPQASRVAREEGVAKLPMKDGKMKAAGLSGRLGVVELCGEGGLGGGRGRAAAVWPEPRI